MKINSNVSRYDLVAGGNLILYDRKFLGNFQVMVIEYEGKYYCLMKHSDYIFEFEDKNDLDDFLNFYEKNIGNFCIRAI